MRYRKLTPPNGSDPGGDRVFGRGRSDFWRDVPDAPAQAVDTRLRLWQGEWFLNLSDGMPWQTRVLGRYTGSTRDPTIRARILGTPGVKPDGIANYSSSLNRDSREFKVNVVLDTVYGKIPFIGPI